MVIAVALAGGGCSAGDDVEGLRGGRGAAASSASPSASAAAAGKKKSKKEKRKEKRERERALASASAEPTSAPRVEPPAIASREGAAVWREASAGRAVSDAAAGAPLVWRTPDGCELEWAVRSSILETSARTPRVAPEGPALEAALQLVAAAGNATMEVKQLALRNETGASMAPPPGAAVSIPLLTREGGRLLGPRTEARAWQRIEGFDGWGILFPLLPPGAEPGAGVDWAVRSSFASEDAADEPQPSVHVAVERWVTMDGVAVALLAASWTETVEQQSTTAGPRKSGASTQTLRGSSTSEGRWAVTAAGRLLFAWRSRADEGELAVSRKGKTSDARRRALDVEARLVRACDGPTLPRFTAR